MLLFVKKVHWLIPDELHATITAQAREECRSIQAQAIVCLERGLLQPARRHDPRPAVLDRLLAALAYGPLTVKQLSDLTGVGCDTVRTLLHRGQRRGVFAPTDAEAHYNKAWRVVEHAVDSSGAPLSAARMHPAVDSGVRLSVD